VGEKAIEWGWSDSPIILPLAFSVKEWNAAYVAAHVSECCGADLAIFHVKSKGEQVDLSFKAEFDDLVSKLKVRHEYQEKEVEGEPSYQTIAELIVGEAERRSAQAVIMAAHKESFFVKMVGRVSDRVARMNKARTVLVETPRPDMRIADHPRKILVLVKEKTKPSDAFILAAALTSLATAKDAELVAAQAMLLPPTVPLEAIEFSDTLKEAERDFAFTVGDGIRSLGRIFTPRILVARELGRDVGEFALSERADLMILTGRSSREFTNVFGTDTTDIVKNSPCAVLVVFPQRA
jgi:nucleotide-binding universal stress UspA family protein